MLKRLTNGWNRHRLAVADPGRVRLRAAGNGVLVPTLKLATN